jgi:hypothetical protein
LPIWPQLKKEEDKYVGNVKLTLSEKKIREAGATYVKNNPNSHRVAVKIYTKNNPDIHRDAVKKYSESHREVNRVALTKYSKNNPQIIQKGVA